MCLVLSASLTRPRRHTGTRSLFTTFMDLPAFANFLAQRDQRHEYEYFRMLLQLLQWQLSVPDNKRWWVNTARASGAHTRTLRERALTRC